MDNQNTPQKDSGTGPIIGSIIIIILIVLGGLYFWGYTIDKQKASRQIIPEQKTVPAINDLSTTTLDIDQSGSTTTATSSN